MDEYSLSLRYILSGSILNCNYIRQYGKICFVQEKEMVVTIKGVGDRPLSRGVVAKNNIAERAESAESGAIFEKRTLNILSFAEMGMNAEEIKLGLIVIAREDVSLDEINNVLRTTVTKKILPKNEHSAKDDASLTEDERVNKVLKLLIAREMLRAPENINKPQGKSEWEGVVASMGEMGQSLGVVKKLLSRGVSLPSSMQIAKLERTPSQEPTVRFAQELAFTDGMITGDLSKSYQLIVICKDNNIELPSLAYYIVFEAFLNAKESKGISPKDLALLNKYQELKDIVFKKKTGNADSSKELRKLNGLENSISRIDDSLVYRMDTRGRYRVNLDGRKLYTPMTYDEDGRMVVDDLNNYMRRARSRDRVRVARKTKTDKGTRTNHRKVRLNCPIGVAS